MSFPFLIRGQNETRYNIGVPTLNILGMFAKYWKPGLVKTRLAKRIGAQAACDIHRLLLEFLLRQFEPIGDRRVLSIWPPEEEICIRRYVTQCLGQASWTIERQSAGNLGEKMTMFFASQFAQGASKCILIGSDCVTIDCQTIHDAFEKLDHHEIVIGPSRDGGYYLIGMNREHFEIFEDIHWSTTQVLSQTVEILNANGVNFGLLEQNFDVDQWDDLCDLLEILADPDSSTSQKCLYREIVASSGRLAETEKTNRSAKFGSPDAV